MAGLFGQQARPGPWDSNTRTAQPFGPQVPSKTYPPEVPYFVNAAYYPNWRIYNHQPPSSLSIGFLSHIFYAFAWVKLDGTVFLSDEWADSQIDVDETKGCLKAFTQLKQQYSELKVILSIGGGGAASNAFPGVAGNPQYVENFAVSAKRLVDSYGLDGIDVDWEFPENSQQGNDYEYLLSRIRYLLPSPQFILTAALPAGEWALRNIDLGTVQTYLDFINLMAYDFSGPWVKECGHHAQLFTPNVPHNEAATISGASAVNYLLSHGVPSKKILLGIPVYGRSFLGANNVGQTYTGCGGSDGTYDYRDVVDSGTQSQIDESVVAAFCHHNDGGFISYDNVRTVEMKAKFAVQNQLGGLFYWHITADARGPQSLVKTGFNTLHDF